LDKPVLLFGLEPEDLGLISLGVGILSLFLGPMVPGVFGFTGWFLLARFKKGKPSGYILHRLYALGFDLPGLLPPPSKIESYSVWKKGRKKGTP
jgi:hypothetical protein